MEKDNLALGILIWIMIVMITIHTYFLLALKIRIDKIEERQYEVNEYILNRIGG